ncbi:MAG TPA: hypothetical protein VGS57_19545 [Thermoanaerobaculia bacterium]|jgi:hypothetical protein|nr:hypothetical protein [Thermoanaerobaculia bacterium]
MACSGWLACAGAFALHIAYEHAKLRSLPIRAALHVAAAVAAGAFVLAIWVTSHTFAPLALLLFPLITAVPAFLVAFTVLVLLSRARRRAGAEQGGE